MRVRSLVVLVLLVSGCATLRQDLAALPVRTASRLAPSGRTAHRIALLPFEDQRGDEWVRGSPERYIPVVNMLHRRHDTFYPEQAARLRTASHGHGVTTAGSLATAMPALLATTMQQMGIPDDVALGDAGAELIVTGRIKRTQLREDTVPLSFLLLGMLGVPYGVSHYDLAYEVMLFDARDRTKPIFSRTYDWHGKRTLGAYYHHQFAYDLFIGGFNDTLPMVIADLDAAIAAHG